MSRKVFIVGGVKSGKSSYAVLLVKSYKRVYFVATAEAKDVEMKKRIEKHKVNRPKNFIVVEEPIKLYEKLDRLPKGSVVVVDCINMWVANMLGKNFSEKKIISEVKKICSKFEKFSFIILVSNEVGLSLVSDNLLGRKFQELLGKTNQIVSSYVNEVYLMVCGIPVRVK